MKLHVGRPNYPGCFRFHRATLLTTKSWRREVFFEHPIRWWFGISFKRLFIGVVKTDASRGYQTVKKRPCPTS